MESVRLRAAAIVSRLEEHNRLEELRCLSLACEFLGPQAQAHLADSLRRELEHMPPRFDENDTTALNPSE